MTQVLEMIFKTGEGKTFRLSLNDPRTDITPTDVQTAMNDILAKNPFNVEGGLNAIQEANIITTDTQPVELV